jgi:hypothetical protein
MASAPIELYQQSIEGCDLDVAQVSHGVFEELHSLFDVEEGGLRWIGDYSNDHLVEVFRCTLDYVQMPDRYGIERAGAQCLHVLGLPS